MDDESTQDEGSVIADEPTTSVDEIIGDGSLVNEDEFQSKENATSSQQPVLPVEFQNVPGRATSPKPQRTAVRIILYAAVLLVGIVLGALGMLLFQLPIG